MKAILAVSIVGILGFLGTAFDPAREMWAPLIVAWAPLLVFMMWPVRDGADVATRSSADRKAA